MPEKGGHADDRLLLRPPSGRNGSYAMCWMQKCSVFLNTHIEVKPMCPKTQVCIPRAR